MTAADVRFDQLALAGAGPYTESSPETIAGCVALHKTTDGLFIEETNAYSTWVANGGFESSEVQKLRVES